MRTGKNEAVVAGADLLSHPAASAWRELDPDRPGPDAIVTLKGKGTSQKKKSSVYRLSREGHGGYVVIAKRCRRATAMNERIVYTDILPQLPIPTLRFYGLVEGAEEADCWLFLEDAGKGRYSREAVQHRHLAAEWLALLHGFGARMSLADRLPSCGPEVRLRELRASRDTISQNIDRPVLNNDDRRVLEGLLSQCDAVESRWDLIVRFYDEMPRTVVHGDFVAKNMRVREDGPQPVLLPYDWECVGWGVPTADLTQHSTHSPFPDLDTYRVGARRFWPQLCAQHVEMLAAVGRIFRLTSGIGWASESLGHDGSRYWLEKPLSQLKTYEHSLQEALRDLDETDSYVPRLTPYPENGALAEGLSSALSDQGVACGVVEVVSRTKNRNQSSFPSELVTCRIDGSDARSLFSKYGAGYVRHSYGHKGGVDYEAEVYRALLEPLGVSVPRLMGTHQEPSRGATWLVLEALDSYRMVSEKVPGSMPLAARWIAEFHTATAASLSTEPAACLHAYDAAYYQGWVERTSRYAADLHHEFRWLRALCERGEEVAELLLRIPRTVIHGEFYYKNVLIQGGTIRPIDWESAAVAFGEIDLAALVDGGWPGDIVNECERDYKAVRWRDDVPADLTSASMLRGYTCSFAG